jgi:hypothetical protein
MKMEETECSETSAYKIKTPGNYPEENIQHTETGKFEIKNTNCVDMATNCVDMATNCVDMAKNCVDRAINCGDMDTNCVDETRY